MSVPPEHEAHRPPKDEFDELDYPEDYLGTHREHLPETAQRDSLKWVAVAAVAALLLGLFCYLLLPGLLSGQGFNQGSNKGSQTSSPVDGQATDDDADKAPSSQAPTSAGSDQPSPSESAKASAAPSSSDSASPSSSTDAIPRGIKVEVYAAGPGQGGQNTVVQRLKQQQFTNVLNGGVWRGFAVSGNTVFYGTDAQAGPAKEVARSLGITQVQQAQVPVVVVVLTQPVASN